MPTASTEIEYYRGDSYSKTVTISDESTDELIDLTGYDLSMVVYDSTSVLFTLVGVLADQVTNMGEVVFTPSQENNDIASGSYSYKVKMSSGTVLRTVKKDKYKILS